MPYTKAILEQIENRLPTAAVTIERANLYMQRADLTRRQFAALCGYSQSTILTFLQGRYATIAGSDAVVRDAIESAMARHPIGSPEITANGRLYETENVEDLRNWFQHCHANRALAFCYGPPGSQKTFVLKHLVAGFNRQQLGREGSKNRAYYVRSSINIQPRDLLAKMCVEAGAIGGSSLQKCISGLRIHLRDTQTVYVIDEAQLLGIPTLEALRELYDEPPQIGVLLAGSHGLKKLFEQRAAELEQWNSRIDAGIELTGVSEARATEIVRTEMPHLSAKTVKGLVDGARVQDAYSRDNRTYLNVRRLFKNLAAYQVGEQQAADAAGAA